MKVLVTRHPALVEYFSNMGITFFKKLFTINLNCGIIANVTSGDVNFTSDMCNRGKIVTNKRVGRSQEYA